MDADELLTLADWRRRIAGLYAEVRAMAAADPRSAWDHWRAVREDLYREHAQSPVPPDRRLAFRADHWPYDPRLRFVVPLEPIKGSAPPDVPWSAAGPGDRFRAAGRVNVPLPSGDRTLTVLWLEGYAGGLFLPFRDATNGAATGYAGRYLLDTAKGADLGGSDDGLVIDLNFAYHPSCAFDERWACPLAPPENGLDGPVEAGERLLPPR